MSELIDISPELHPGTAVWPGDVPFSRTVALSIEGGDNLELSSITTTLHVGAHADAPNHYRKGGQDIASRPLAPYYGDCQVVTVDVGRDQRITPEHVTVPIAATRVLFKTGTFPNPDLYNTDFAALSPALVHWLAGLGVVLIGIDTPSVDLFSDKILMSHAAIGERDLCVLEGIVLEHVPDGPYTLIALPLKIRAADASPVRAALIPRRGVPESASS